MNNPDADTVTLNKNDPLVSLNEKLISHELELIKLHDIIDAEFKIRNIKIQNLHQDQTNIDKSIKEEFKDLFVDWMSFTTIHGVTRILDARGFFLKLMWFILFMCGIAGTLYLLVIQIQVYFDFQEVTSTQIIPDFPAEFPTITICNLNPFYINNMSTSDFDKLENYDSYCNGQQVCNISNSSSAYTAIKFQTLSSTLKNQYFVQELLKNKNPKKKFLDKTLDCYFNGISCMHENDFEIFPTLDNYFCFKFNGNKSNIKTIGRKGPSSRFSFTFNLDSQQYELLTKNRGLRIYISNSTEDFPNIDRNYIDIAPGFETNIAIKRTFYQKLSQPYTDCIDDLTPSNPQTTVFMDYMFNLLNMTSYSFKVCESLVYQHFLNITCKCLDSSFLYLDWKDLYLKLNESDHLLNDTCRDTKQIECMNSFNSNFSAQPYNYMGNSCPSGKK